MNFKDLKQYLYDHNLIEDLLSSIECGCIKYHNKGYFTASNIDGDNPSAVVIYNEPFLHMHNYTRNFRNTPDIFDLIIYNLRIINSNNSLGIVDASKYVHDFIGIKYEGYKPSKKKGNDPLAIFKKVKLCYQKEINYEELEKYDNYDFRLGLLHSSWLKEGLTQKTINKFDIGYSFQLKRIIIPLKFWNTGEVIGFNKRTVIDNYKELGIKKYLLTPNYPKQINLYGLWENKESIELNGYCTIFEAEKSVLKRDSRNDSTGIALQGHTISKEQVSIICGLNINEIIIALDKDIDLNEVRFICEKFYRKKKVSYIYDKYGLLNEKDSPADAKEKIYKHLFKYRVKYDYKEHLELMNYLKNGR